jgi:hypothetical protein
MKRLMPMLLPIALLPALSSCSVTEQETAPSPAPTPQVTAAAPAPVQPGTVMTGEDMERLHRDRKELIDRPTPLGEEQDAVAALRGQSSR